jgi:hypothetical protein
MRVEEVGESDRLRMIDPSTSKEMTDALRDAISPEKQSVGQAADKWSASSDAQSSLA